MEAVGGKDSGNIIIVVKNCTFIAVFKDLFSDMNTPTPQLGKGLVLS